MNPLLHHAKIIGLVLEAFAFVWHLFFLLHEHFMDWYNDIFNERFDLQYSSTATTWRLLCRCQPRQRAHKRQKMLPLRFKQLWLCDNAFESLLQLQDHQRFLASFDSPVEEKRAEREYLDV